MPYSNPWLWFLVILHSTPCLEWKTRESSAKKMWWSSGHPLRSVIPGNLWLLIAWSICHERIYVSSIKSYTESGSPCRNPRVGWIHVVRLPLTNTLYVGVMMHARIHWIHLPPKSCLSRLWIKNSHSARSYTFCISNLRAHSVFLPLILCWR